MRKGSTEMWWIIIGAVIALIVLIILLVLFTGKTGGLEKGLTECEGKSGICVDKPLSGSPQIAKGCPDNTLETSTFSCLSNKVCCIGIPKKCDGESDTTTCGTGKTCSGYGDNKFFCIS